MYFLQIMLLLIPVAALETYSILEKKYIFVLLVILLTFAWVRSSILARCRENLWLFIYTFFFSIPYNIVLVKNIYTFLDFDSPAAGKALCTVLAVWLICAEEMIIGIIGRIIWKKQNGFGSL